MIRPAIVPGQRFGSRLVLEVRSSHYSPASPRYGETPRTHRGMRPWLHLRCDCGALSWTTPESVGVCCRACVARRTRSAPRPAATGHMVAGPGDRDTECARYETCLDGVARARGDEWHCPPRCAERVEVPREYHRALATERRCMPVYPASGWGE